MRADSPSHGSIFRACAAKFGLVVKDRSEPLGSEDRCRAALETAGFDRIDVIAGHVPFGTLDTTLAWESNFRAAGRDAAQALSPHQREELRQQYVRALEQAIRDDPAGCSQADVLFAIGRRAERAAAAP
jgi:hypothetical protein